ncbi:hypothetical protein BMS77_09070 [Leuconostoc pseudomesenteroides]|uniref:Uncharacterized protein n=1 Tax=Leuconostoc pseudomesenteroides TaxID=33968 RepID=A0A1X0VBP8_LEUPS|nr:hypothetical protein [Leuconostoc pseudomesenteroides]OQJ70526.1 hypothetical protein BMS77_09070 [Leuconostoc pseudomesenteroides]OQJ75361.1 hypothetical protein BMS83_08480 [Leuconostoc pseudomesenteroides]OQJ76130.1 hypothetical protein BMS82_08330 [Leuconostoc pseudomesenteroides]ORI35983.1 hypothetical protein BMR88_08505 [Leuconostoc pseudomesenteroides]ORI44614.1 hypothetical protein BMR94_08665 [Leuconostoc pseudomesenteroides]
MNKIEPKDVELNHRQRKLLRYIYKHSDIESEKYIDVNKIPNNSLDKTLLMNDVNRLINNRLVSTKTFSDDIGNQRAIKNLLIINTDGIEYFDWVRERTINYLLKSVLVPIFVALTISVITNIFFEVYPRVLRSITDLILNLL